jgi:hypothetical protein
LDYATAGDRVGVIAESREFHKFSTIIGEKRA